MNFTPFLRISRVSWSLISNLRINSSIFSVPARQFNSLQTAVSPIRLLVPWTPQSVSSCGFKVKGKLKKRCKDCYMVVRDERTYIICPTHPRHKQMSFKKKEKKNIIMTPFPVQSKQRMW